MGDHAPHRIRDAALTILFLGSLWGAVEASVGGMLHRALPPTYPGRLMLAIAMALLAYAVRKTRAPWMPLGMAAVAAPLKLASSVVYGLPPTAPEILNPALAIVAEGAVFAVLSVMLWRRDRDARLVPIGAGAGVLQWIVWVGLVVWVGGALYPPDAVLADLGAKLAPAWAASLSSIAAMAPQALLTGLVAGLIGAAAAVSLPRPRPLVVRPAALAAGTALCVAIFFAASWAF